MGVSIDTPSLSRKLLNSACTICPRSRSRQGRTEGASSAAATFSMSVEEYQDWAFGFGSAPQGTPDDLLQQNRAAAYQPSEQAGQLSEAAAEDQPPPAPNALLEGTGGSSGAVAGSLDDIEQKLGQPEGEKTDEPQR
eukprot:scaffold155874_cov39-Prasinocladus_malaysianus.AAC.1